MLSGCDALKSEYECPLRESARPTFFTPAKRNVSNFGYMSVPSKAWHPDKVLFVIRNRCSRGVLKSSRRITSPWSLIFWLFAAQTLIFVDLMLICGIRLIPFLVIKLIDAPLSNKTFIILFSIFMLKSGSLQVLYGVMLSPLVNR